MVTGAVFKGGWEERAACMAFLWAIVMSRLFKDLRWSGIQWGAFCGDLILLGVLLYISLRTRRFWPLAAAGFQVLNVAVHVARMVDPGVRSWAYATGQVIFTWLLLIALGVGVYAAWRDPSPAGAAAGPSPAPRP